MSDVVIGVFVSLTFLNCERQACPYQSVKFVDLCGFFKNAVFSISAHVYWKIVCLHGHSPPLFMSTSLSVSSDTVYTQSTHINHAAGRALFVALLTDSQNFVDLYQFKEFTVLKLYIAFDERSKSTLDFISR